MTSAFKVIFITADGLRALENRTFDLPLPREYFRPILREVKNEKESGGYAETAKREYRLHSFAMDDSAAANWCVYREASPPK